MTPEPPPSTPDGDKPLPPRHRPSLGTLNQDTTEMDLWAFDEELENERLPMKEARSSGSELPSPRQRRVERRDKELGEGGEAAAEQVRMNVSKARPQSQKQADVPTGRAEISDFDDLESWDDQRTSAAPDLDELPPEPEPAVEAAVPDGSEELPDAATTAAQQGAPEVPAAAEEDEFSPVVRADVQPANLHPRLRLSRVERMGMIALAVILVAGGLFSYVFILRRLPTETSRASMTDFPIQGEKVVIDAADTYWREPVNEGPDVDTVRRGTRLLPVIELRITGGSGAVRVLFRNEDRLVIGDAVTRRVDGAATIKIPATAGFDDLGMHAAYRTGGSKPWTAEVFEAASVNAPGRDFKRLFEMDISTARR